MSEPDANRLLGHNLDTNRISGLLHYSYNPAETFNQQSYFDLVTWLANDLLVKLDRMTMAASIEGRAPYLDTKLVEYCLRILKPSDKTNDKSNKLALRQAARRYIPESILGRKKQGFILPMQKWITEFINSRDGITNYLASIDTGPINKRALQEMLEANHKAKNERLLFSLIVLLEWLNK
jgi:asparagine synthase (glutamine-hydrolysing)